MSNQNLLPRTNGSGSLGTPTKKWGDAHFKSATIDSLNATITGLSQSGSFEGDFTGSFSGDGSNLELVKSVQHRLNSITVNEKSDFPAPIDGVITLEEETEYFLNGMVDIGTDEIRYNTGSYLAGLNVTKDVILYQGTGSAINADGIGQVVGKWFGVMAPAGSALSVSGSIGVQFNYEYVAFLGCNSVGNIDGFDVAALKSCAIIPVPGLPARNGVTFGGTSRKIFIDGSVFQDTTNAEFSVRFDETFSTDVVDISQNYFKSDELTSIEVHPSASIAEGRVITNIFTGTKTNGPLTGVSTSDIGWEFIANSGVADSAIAINYYIPDGQAPIPTPIPAIDTPVKIEAVTVANPDSQKFDHSGSNRATYTGLKPIIASITAVLSLEVLANNQSVEILLYKNGSLIPGSRSQIRIQNSGIRQSVTALAGVRMNTGDYVEVWVQNLTSDTDVTAYTLSLFARE